MSINYFRRFPVRLCKVLNGLEHVEKDKLKKLNDILSESLSIKQIKIEVEVDNNNYKVHKEDHSSCQDIEIENFKENTALLVAKMVYDAYI